MCGFVGFAGRSLPPQALSRASSALAHRGPDGEGTFRDERQDSAVAFAHRRLAILDLTELARQPMHSGCGRYVIAYNGELFNYQELRQTLGRDVPWRTTSDTEVLLEYLVKHGPNGLPDCLGMFAFALYDKESRGLLLARDQLGVKPLYWALHEGSFCFASEIKALFALGVPARLRREALGEFLLRGWVEHPDTAFDGVHSVEPGSWISWRDGRLAFGRYWDLEPKVGAEGDQPELEPLLRDAVQKELVADRLVGMYVSGGIDSSIIYALANGEAPGRHLSLTARFAEGDIDAEGVEDDGRWADELLARHPRDRRAEVVMTSDLYERYGDLVWRVEEPMADPAVVPSYLLAQRANELGVVVMLSGMGGDEVFGGYRRYALAPYWNALCGARAAVGPILRALAGGAQGAGVPAARRWGSYAERLNGAIADGWPLAYASLAGHIPAREVDDLTGRDWRGPLVDKLNRSLDGWRGRSWLSQAQRLDLRGFLASHNLMYADKTSMAASVEVRVPFLDHRVVEAAFRLPDRERASLTSLKPWLRRLCERLVGPRIANRKKAGFTMPIRAWMTGHLGTEVHRRLCGERLAAAVNPAGIRKIQEDHSGGRRDNTWKLWTLLTLDLWLERFGID